MAFLVAGGQTIPVWPSSGRRRDLPVGEVYRAFSGAPRSSVRAYVLEWVGIETKWISRSQADTIRTALKATTPIACTGDLTGGINAYIQNIQEIEKGRKMIGGASVEGVRLSFDLLQA